MTMHIQRFVDRVKGFEARGAKDFSMSLSDAKDLHADITKLLLELHALREQAITARQEETITVQMDGGKF